MEEIAAYVAQGAPDAAQLVNMSTGAEVWKPMASGVIVGESQESYEAAKQVARTAVARFALKADAEASWPTSEHARAHETIAEMTARVGTIFHLGMAMQDLEAMPDGLEDALETIADYGQDDPIWADLPKPPHTDDIVDDDDDDDAVDDSEFYGTWLENMLRHNVFGFLARVEVAIPSYRSPNENGFSFSWGVYSMHWVYAESMDEISRKTREIVQHIHHREREQARQRQQAA